MKRHLGLLLLLAPSLMFATSCSKSPDKAADPHPLAPSKVYTNTSHICEKGDADKMTSSWGISMANTPDAQPFQDVTGAIQMTRFPDAALVLLYEAHSMEVAYSNQYGIFTPHVTGKVTHVFRAFDADGYYLGADEHWCVPRCPETVGIVLKTNADGSFKERP